MFSGNQALLITDNSLQEYLADKNTGLPLSNGVVTFYRDNSRTVFKNVYYQTGTFGAYTYTALPNPLTLNASGQVVDNDGNITKIFYYPYDSSPTPQVQPYYITIDDELEARQYTLENFPFIPVFSSSVTPNPTLKNIITNGTFWRNGGSFSSGTINANSSPNIVVCPGAHDGFTNGDIRFLKNVNTATDAISFNKIPNTIIFNNDVTPEYCANFQCTASTTGETLKCFQFPMQLHLQNLNQTQITTTFWAQLVSGGNQISVNFYKFAGSDQLGSSEVLTGQTFNINTTWTKYSFTYTLPDISSLPVSLTGDDAYYLQIQMPTNINTNLNITKACVYIGNVVPGNEFQTYDQIHAVTDAPRTSHIKISSGINADCENFGWVPMNNGTIGSAASTATTRNNSDTFSLYSLLWNRVNDLFAPVTGGRGASALSDFIANKPICLLKGLGAVLAGATQLTNSTPVSYSASGGTDLTVTSSTGLDGMPVQISINTPTDPIQSGQIYYSTVSDPTHIKLSLYPGSTNYITFTTNGTGEVAVIETGQVYGETSHQQTLGELHEHTHLPNGGNSDLVSPQNPGTVYSAGAIGTAVNLQNTGNSLYANNMQPTLYMNFYMKL